MGSAHFFVWRKVLSRTWHFRLLHQAKAQQSVAKPKLDEAPGDESRTCFDTWSRTAKPLFYLYLSTRSLLTCSSMTKHNTLQQEFYTELTRSLPRDVYIRRQNDHPGGQGRIYTSHLNFVSTLLSKPGHRRGCCCMSPRCLLRQFVDRCLLFGAFFIEKTVLLCFARFLSKWRETALWLIPDATSWYELYVWWL